MVDPMEEESRKEEEKKREKIRVLKGEFYELLEEAKLRFNFASRKTENTDLLSDLLKKMRDTIIFLYDNRRGGHVQAVSERLLPDAVGLGVDFRNILIGSLF
uniref:Uncharacterized protein n=1 Tax=Pristionchus pacificus TaxID=54126 RepID=A0A8R1U8P6_PRIPA